MKSSVIIVWPDSFDYPVFRSKLPELLSKVDEVLICFTQHGDYPMRLWLQQQMKHDKVSFLDAEAGSVFEGDWRNQATNLLLSKSKGEIIISLEQDFVIKDYGVFFNKVNRALHLSDVVKIQDGERFHPCFLAWKKTLTPRDVDFSAMGSNKDHFYDMTEKLIKQKINIVELEDIDLFRGRDWFHIAGLTENYFASKPYYDLDTFYIYNDKCQKIPTNEYWQQQMKRCEGSVSGQHVLNSFI